MVDDPAVAPPRQALSQELVRHARLLHVLRTHMSTLTPSGLDWSSFSLLAHLVKGGPRRQGELADCALLDPSTVSRQVGQLVRLGHAERRPDPVDGRAVRLAATESGVALFHRVAARRDEIIDQMLSGWSDEDVDTLLRLLRRLNDDFEAHRPLRLRAVVGDPAPGFARPRLAHSVPGPQES